MARRASSKVDSPKAVPDRLYFKIGEAAQIVGVEPYVLRYWETEFPEIAPTKRRGQRRYKKEEVESLLAIRNLLYEKGFTIAGAKKHLKFSEQSPKEASPQPQKQMSLDLATKQNSSKLKQELEKKLKELEAIFD